MIKDKLLVLLFWAAVALEMTAAFSLLDSVYLRVRKLLQSKKGAKNEQIN